MKTQNKPLFLSMALLAASIGVPFLALAAEDNAAKTSASDERFLQQEVAANTAELKMAELATKKATRDDVRSYAEMLVSDHTKANAELTALAEKKGANLADPATDKHADTYRDLEAASGDEFDKKFLAAAIKSHRKCVKNFEKASTDSEDSEVKALAAKMLPTLQAHLQKAEELKSRRTSTLSSSSDTSATTDNPAANSAANSDATGATTRD